MKATNIESKSNLLDFSDNKEFILKVLEGDRKSFKELEKWFIEQNQSNKIDKNNSHIYELVKSGYNISNINKDKIEKLTKEKEILNVLADPNANESHNTFFEQIVNIIKNTQKELEQKFKTEKEEIEQKFKTEKEEIEQKFKTEKEEIEQKLKTQKDEVEHKLNEKLELEKKGIEQKIIDNRIKIFIQSINDYKLLKNTFISDSIIKYTNQKIDLNNLQIVKLSALINDLYSFKNVYIYRKITNILLKKIIIKYKDDLSIDKSNKIKVKEKFKYSNSLALLIDFFFFVKKKQVLLFICL